MTYQRQAFQETLADSLLVILFNGMLELYCSVKTW
jgi:hypothetical protein